MAFPIFHSYPFLFLSAISLFLVLLIAFSNGPTSSLVPSVSFASGSDIDIISEDDDSTEVDYMPPVVDDTHEDKVSVSINSPEDNLDFQTGGLSDSSKMTADLKMLKLALERVSVPEYERVDSFKSFHVLETFDDDKHWVRSASAKFTGPWLHTTRRIEGIKNDLGLRVGGAAELHGISRKLDKRLEMKKGDTLVVQYEAKFEDNLHCGGAYLKLFDIKGEGLGKFDADTDYVVMFGPDRCGETDKIHFILKVTNPHTAKTTEHHLNSPPKVPRDTHTHLYTLLLKPDDTVEIWVDNKFAKRGNLGTDMTPPINPEKEISDVNDTKPIDWDDRETIPDPNMTEPWDGTQPEYISDPSAVPPEGWLLDAPLTIDDPNSTKPEDWNEEEMGPWEILQISNPLCSVGCGPWPAPTIPNPLYKGVWKTPTVKNPNYKGPWKPRNIPNLEFLKEPLHVIAPVDSIGFELWTMQSGLMFDNIIVSSIFKDAQKFADVTWKIRAAKEEEIETMMNQLESEMIDKTAKTDGLLAKQIFEKHPFVVIGSSASLLLLLIGFIIRQRRLRSLRGDKTMEAQKQKQVDKKKDKEDDEGEDKEEEKEEENEEDEQEKEEMDGEVSAVDLRQRKGHKTAS